MSTQPPDQHERLRQTMALLWQKNLPLVRERLEEIERAAAAAAVAPLPPETRSAAAATAHKLAGSLGMFGYPQATEFARAIEQRLHSEGELDAVHLQELTASLRAALPLD